MVTKERAKECEDCQALREAIGPLIELLSSREEARILAQHGERIRALEVRMASLTGLRTGGVCQRLQ